MIIIVGVVIFLMGCFLGFQSIGYWVLVLLVVFWFFQGFVVGGEWGGVVFFVVEQSFDCFCFFWLSWFQVVVLIGNFFVMFVFFVSFWVMSLGVFFEWGWCIVFWFLVVIVLVGFYICCYVEEVLIFFEVKVQVEVEKVMFYGVVEVLCCYLKGILQVMGICFVENIVYYIVVSFMIVYLKIVYEYDMSQFFFVLFIVYVVYFVIILQLG